MDILKKFNNNIYFLDVISNKIIINDNYDGIIILDELLNEIKNIKLIDQLIIETSFIKGSDIILFDYESQCFIYLNTKSYEYKIIKLSIDFEDIILTPFFEWIENDLFLIDYDATIIIHIDLLKGCATIVNKDYINQHRLEIKDNWNKLRKYLTHKVYSLKHLAIIENNDILTLLDFKYNIKNDLNIQRIKFHNIEFNEFNIVQISEKQILLFIGEKYIILQPELEGYIFLSAKFGIIDNITYLFILMTCNYESKLDIIKRYCIADIKND